MRLNDNAVRGGNRAQTGDNKFSAENNDDRPRRREMFFDQNDQSRRNKKFIGNRVEKFAEIGNLIASSRQMSVENISKRRDEKDDDCQRVTADPEPFVSKRCEQDGDQQRDDDNSR